MTATVKNFRKIVSNGENRIGEFIMPIATLIGEQSEQEIETRKLASDYAIATLQKLVEGTNIPWVVCVKNTFAGDIKITHFAYAIENGCPVFSDTMEVKR